MEEIEQEYNINQDLIDGLVELVEFLKQHPKLPNKLGTMDLDFWFYSTQTEEFKATLKMLGSYKKHYSDYYFTVTKTFGGEDGKVTINISSPRDTMCRKVVVGQELREIEEDVPLSPEDQETLSKLLDLRKKKVQKMVDITTWECPPTI